MALNDILSKQIASAFTGVLGKGGFTEDITVRYQVSAGEYDAETDTTSPVYNDVPVKNIIVAKPGADDIKDSSVLRTDAKLIIPGLGFTEPEVDVDLVVRANGEEWDIRKTIGVPGGSVWIIFIYRT